MLTEERFWSHVDASGDCWEWTAARFRGYGQFNIHKGKVVRAHRFAYETLVGPIPEGMPLDHLCRNPPCVNPDHLEPVTTAENNRRSGPAAILSRRSHCKRGHAFDDTNTYHNHRGHRECLTCKRELKRRWRAAA